MTPAAVPAPPRRLRRTPPRQYKDKSPRQRSRPATPAGIRVLPRHVRACRHSPDKRERWAIWSWKKSDPRTRKRTQYACNSWRCQSCQRHEAAVTFARIRDACSPLDARGFVYAVLTIDRGNGKLPFVDAATAYRALSGMCERWLKRTRRWMARRGMKPFGSEWVSVVEAHKSGWPHLNVLLYAPELAEYLERVASDLAATGATKRQQRLLWGELLDHATEAGWGRQCTAERVASTGAIAGYFTQLAKHCEKGIAEVAKLTQLPMNAPERLRRLRSGKGFLPPRRKNPETTGALVMSRASDEGDYEVRRLNPPSEALHNRVARSCVQHERTFLLDDEQRESFNRVAARFGVPQKPPPIVVVVTVKGANDETSNEEGPPRRGGSDTAAHHEGAEEEEDAQLSFVRSEHAQESRSVDAPRRQHAEADSRLQ